MSTLTEVEAAAGLLSAPEQQELLLYLATRLHASAGPLPPPRDLPLERIERWIAADQAAHQAFLAGS